MSILSFQFAPSELCLWPVNYKLKICYFYTSIAKVSIINPGKSDFVEDQMVIAGLALRIALCYTKFVRPYPITSQDIWRFLLRGLQKGWLGMKWSATGILSANYLMTVWNGSSYALLLLNGCHLGMSGLFLFKGGSILHRPSPEIRLPSCCGASVSISYSLVSMRRSVCFPDWGCPLLPVYHCCVCPKSHQGPRTVTARTRDPRPFLSPNTADDTGIYIRPAFLLMFPRWSTQCHRQIGIYFPTSSS